MATKLNFHAGTCSYFSRDLGHNVQTLQPQPPGSSEDVTDFERAETGVGVVGSPGVMFSTACIGLKVYGREFGVQLKNG